MRSRKSVLVLALAAAAARLAALPQALGQQPAEPAARYQRPPQAIIDILDVPPTPQASLSPTRDQLLLIQRPSHPSIADVAAPMLRLAGLRINPQTNGPHLAPYSVGLTLQ